MNRILSWAGVSALIFMVIAGTSVANAAAAKPLKTKEFPIGVTETLPEGLIDDLPDGTIINYVYAADVNSGYGIVAVDIEFPSSSPKEGLGINDAFVLIRDDDDVVAKPVGPDSGLEDVIDAGVYYARPYPDGEDTVGFLVMQDEHLLFIVQKGWMLIDVGADADMIARYATTVMRDGLEETPLPNGPGWRMLETSYPDRDKEGW